LAREVAQGRRGSVTIGLIGAATFEAAPRILASAEAHAPDLDVRFIELSASRQLEVLRSGDRSIDAGLVRAEARAAGLSFRTVLREPVLCLLPEGHRLAAQDSVTIADLEGEPVLNLSREHDPAGHDAYLAMYRAAGFEPNLVMEISQIATILFAVATKRCVALGPAGWRVLHRDGVVYRPIAAPAPMVETRLAWNPKQVSPGLSLLLELTSEGQRTGRI
jgi:DNA-binding transcriptional LysR family regulator